MTTTRRTVLTFVGGSLAACVLPFGAGAAGTSRSGIGDAASTVGPKVGTADFGALDRAIRTVGPDAFALQAGRSARVTEDGAMWFSKTYLHALAAGRLADERGILSSGGFLACADLEAMRDASTDLSLSPKTRSAIRGQLTSLPGFHYGCGPQMDVTLRRHDHVLARLAAMIGDLRDAGGSIVPQVLAGTVDWEAIGAEPGSRLAALEWRSDDRRRTLVVA